MNDYKVIDCFCGAGGLSLGFENTGFDVEYAFDLDESAINTYKRNPQYHHGAAFVRDIYNVSKDSIEEDLGRPLGTVDVVIGGPPCQGFSVQRRGDDNESTGIGVRSPVERDSSSFLHHGECKRNPFSER